MKDAVMTEGSSPAQGARGPREWMPIALWVSFLVGLLIPFGGEVSVWWALVVGLLLVWRPSKWADLREVLKRPEVGLFALALVPLLVAAGMQLGVGTPEAWYIVLLPLLFMVVLIFTGRPLLWGMAARYALTIGAVVGVLVLFAFQAWGTIEGPSSLQLFLTLALVGDMVLVAGALRERVAWGLLMVLLVIPGIYPGPTLDMLLLPFAFLPFLWKVIGRVPNSIGRLSLWVVVALGWLFCVSYIAHVPDAFFVSRGEAQRPLPTRTSTGGVYVHDTLSGRLINGYPLGLFLCEEELERGWSRLSARPYEGESEAGTPIRECLAAYITSLGHRKDSIGLSFLTAADVRAVERGEYNVALVNRGPVYRRLWHELDSWEEGRRAGVPANGLGATFVAMAGYPELLSSAPWYGLGAKRTLGEYGELPSPLQLPVAYGLVPVVVSLLLVLGAMVLSMRRQGVVTPLVLFLGVLLGGLTGGTVLGYGVVLILVWGMVRPKRNPSD